VLISVVGRHTDVPDELKEYANQKANRLVKFYDRIQAIEVVFEEEKENRTVELIITAEPKKLCFVARATGKDLATCFDVALDKASRRLKRHKERVRNRKGLERAPEIQPEPPGHASEET